MANRWECGVRVAVASRAREVLGRGQYMDILPTA